MHGVCDGVVSCHGLAVFVSVPPYTTVLNILLIDI